nr:leucine-rich repeat and fibronectin type-III domain-containing protein 4-like [Rhipicephalus microplus]
MAPQWKFPRRPQRSPPSPALPSGSLRVRRQRSATSAGSSASTSCRPKTSLSTLSAESERTSPRRLGSSWRTVVWSGSPTGAFADLNIYKLAFYNVSVVDFAQQGPTGNPFEGLEDTLREVVFHSGSTLPPSWSVFQGIHKLEEVCIDDYENLRLTTDFNKLPKTVKSIYVTKSTVEHVDPDWLTSLENLEALVLRKTSLKVFSRRWLPMPAPNFFLLDLPDNQLEAFPEGLADDLPRLSVVNLQRNKLTTVDEKAVAPLKDKTVFVNFADNPMHCDCRLRFLLTYTHRWHYFLCRTPQSLFDRYFHRLTEGDLQCSATAPLSST